MVISTKDTGLVYIPFCDLPVASVVDFDQAPAEHAEILF